MSLTRSWLPTFMVMIAIGALLLAPATAPAKLIETGTMTDAEGSWDFTLVRFTITTDPPSDPKSLQPGGAGGVMTMVVDKNLVHFQKAVLSGELVYLEIKIRHQGGECITVDMADVAFTEMEIHTPESTGEAEAEVRFTVTGAIVYN